MGSLSVSTHRGLVHWKGLLLVVSFLTFWSLPTTAKLSIASTFAVEGRNVLLRVRNPSSDALRIVWYKGNGTHNDTVTSFLLTPSFFTSDSEYCERALVLSDGSLVLKTVTTADTGIYTAVVHFPNSEIDMGTGLLHVYEYMRRPDLRASSHLVTENEDDVVLTCDTNGPTVQWLFNDMQLKFTYRKKLTEEGKRITIDPVKREDAGVYKCIASNPVMKVESQPLSLRVQYE